MIGLGNNVYTAFKEWLSGRIEEITLEEIAAMNMSVLAEISVDNALIKLDDLRITVDDLVDDWKKLNAKLKERGLNPQYIHC